MNARAIEPAGSMAVSETPAAAIAAEPKKDVLPKERHSAAASGPSEQEKRKSPAAMAPDFGSAVFKEKVVFSYPSAFNILLSRVYGGRYPGVHLGKEHAGGVCLVSFEGKGGTEERLSGVYALHTEGMYELRRTTPYVEALIAGRVKDIGMAGGCIGLS
jgi:hypothetical protein